MLGSIASDWTLRIGDAWDRVPDGRGRRAALVAASVVINLGLLLALTASASGGGALPPKPIMLTIVSGDVPRAAAVLPPPPQQVLPKPAPAAPSSPRTRAPTVSPGAETAPPLTLPASPGDAPGVETIPADIGTTSPVVPKGLQRYLQADPCIDAATRKLHPECKSTYKAATDALSDRDARADRAERVLAMEKDLGLHNDCGSTHLGCAAPPDKTLAGAVIPRGQVDGRNPMSANGQSGIGQSALQRPNAYHVDPGFGD